MITNSIFQVYIAVGSTDMRKSVNGLSSLVASQYSLNPLNGMRMHENPHWRREIRTTLAYPCVLAGKGQHQIQIRLP